MSTAVGKEAEDRASLYMQQEGYTILARNFHSKFGEIDIIAHKEDILHFCEVKYSKLYDPIIRITPSKMAKISKTIDYYFLKMKVSCDYEIDAILVTEEKLELIKNISY
ncbi:MAG: YraN family protein [Sulfurospirillaceae bacterium]|jgi:putative endonuclease|nr:YraN family protein [Sulfurospirillaceae bacterium]MDD2825476.1 YraN family protein [Sulfurospirillaceae bacterium]